MDLALALDDLLEKGHQAVQLVGWEPPEVCLPGDVNEGCSKAKNKVPESKDSKLNVVPEGPLKVATVHCQYLRGRQSMRHPVGLCDHSFERGINLG